MKRANVFCYIMNVRRRITSTIVCSVCLCFFLFSEFEEVLKVMRWPTVPTTMKAPPVSNYSELKTRLQRLFKKLLHLQLPYPVCLLAGFSCEKVNSPNHPHNACNSWLLDTSKQSLSSV